MSQESRLAAETDIGFARQMIGEMVSEIKILQARFPDDEVKVIATVASQLWNLDQRRACQFLAVALVAQADHETGS